MNTHRRLGWVALGVAAVAGVGLTVAAANGFGFAPADAAEDWKPPATAEITRQDLVATVDESGKLAHARETALRAAGGVVTWVPAEGALIERGGQLYRVDDAPVMLLYGTLPAYRELSSGAEGADVRQFEENLAALGYTGFTVDDEYTWATAEAVMSWQEDLDLPETGVVELGRVHYASSSVQVTSTTAAPGDPASGELLKVASPDRVVTVDLDEDDRRFAVVGAAVTVQIPDGSTFSGTITGVKSVVIPGDDSPSGGSGDTTVLRVTVAPDDPSAVPASGSSTATVSFTAERREGVLTVPVTALLALAEGGYGVELFDEDDGTRLVAVETGLFADGRVEISGEDISEDAHVVVPE